MLTGTIDRLALSRAPLKDALPAIEIEDIRTRQEKFLETRRREMEAGKTGVDKVWKLRPGYLRY